MVPQIRKQGDEGRKLVWFGARREKDERERMKMKNVNGKNQA